MLGQKVSEWGINLLLRAVLCVLAVHFLNLFLLDNGYSTLVGINCYTLPVMAVLGFPSIGLLYGLALFW